MAWRDLLALMSASALACLALAQCAAPAPEGERVASMDAIAGQWDMVSFGRHRPQRLDADGQRHAFVDISANGDLAFAIECNYSGIRARVNAEGRLIPDLNDGSRTAMGCGQERERRDDALFAFMQSQPIVTRAGDEMVLSNDDIRLVLQRPERRRARALPRTLADLGGSWTASILYYEVEPGNNRNLIAPLDGAPARFEVTADRFVLSFDCESIEAHAQLNAPGLIDFSAPRRRATASCRVPEADRDLGVSLLNGAAQVERIDDQRVHLVAGPVRAVLEREAH